MKYQVPLAHQDIDQCSNSSYGIVLRSSGAATNWDLCFICQQVKCKGETNVAQVVTSNIYEKMVRTADYRDDELMKTRIQDVDLVALQGKYHKGCY